MGPLAVVPGSQRIDRLISTYGRTYVNRDGVDGHMATDPLQIIEAFGLIWRTTKFEAGDLLLFGKYLLHGSLENRTRQYRLSTDTRFQRIDKPIDPEFSLDLR